MTALDPRVCANLGRYRAARSMLLLALLTALGLPLPAAAQASCAAPADVAPDQLHGLWRAEFDGRGAAGTVLLEAHRVHLGSLAGAINRDGAQSLVVADLEAGDFTMEESSDGVRIGATWLGRVTEGSCGREIAGERTGGWDRAVRFVLRKVP